MFLTPLLELPYNFQKGIINELDLIQIWKLFQESKKFEQLLGEVKLNVEQLKWSTGLTKDESEINIKNRNECLQFYVGPDKEMETTAKTEFDLRGFVITGREITGSPFVNVTTRHVNLSSLMPITEKLDPLEVMTKYLMQFVQVVQSYEAKIERKDGDIRDLFIWSYTKEFKDFELDLSGPLEISEDRRLVPNDTPLTSDELIFVLEDVTTDKLVLKVIVDNANFKYNKPIRSPNVRIHNHPAWLDLDNFFKQKCGIETIYLFSFLIPDSTINTILKNILFGGENDQLKSVDFHKSRREHNVEGTMDGITYKQTAFRQMPLSTALTMETHRNSDGKIAEIRLNPSGCQLKIDTY